MATYCEDYPCCGHTPQDPCEPQWYDKPGAFDTSRPGNEHALCDHENGICEAELDFDDDDKEDDGDDAGIELNDTEAQFWAGKSSIPDGLRY
jgi:hypothetical protein